MPNWTENIVRVSGRREDVAVFAAMMQGDDGVFDFNAIIHMPMALRGLSCGYNTVDGDSVTVWVEERLPDGSAKPRKLTDAEWAQVRATGFTSWYDWAYENWGTKWNACDVYLKKHKDQKALTYKFSTAWSPPMPVYEKMRKAFPSLTFYIKCRDEDRDNDSWYIVE
jgi:hypothetical protein